VLIEFHRAAFSSVEIDDEAGGYLAGTYLVAQGHRRCGFVGDSEVPAYAIHTSDRRLIGYRRALREAGLDLRESYCGLALHGLEWARQQAHRLLSLPEPPTAVFAASDTQAMGVLKAARERGLRVPDDLAVIGFDDIDIAEYIGLTTIRQPLDDSGRVAVELLFSRFEHPERTIRRVNLPLTLVRRETA
jgi:DNA-binding LacI/PurR family transcriptional regulator